MGKLHQEKSPVMSICTCGNEALVTHTKIYVQFMKENSWLFPNDLAFLNLVLFI